MAKKNTIDEGKAQEARLKAPAIRVMKLRLIGDTTYIPHRAGDRVKADLLGRQVDKIKTKQKRDIDAEYDDCFYRTSDGELFIPGGAFARALLSAVTDFDGVSGAEVKRNIRILSDECIIEYGEIEPKLDRVVLAGKGRTMDVRKRPYIHDWKTAVMVQFNADKFSPEEVSTMFHAAGQCVGVGDWRPEKGGNHGMWHLAKEMEVD